MVKAKTYNLRLTLHKVYFFYLHLLQSAFLMFFFFFEFV